jgi:hypothetical protein
MHTNDRAEIWKAAENGEFISQSAGHTTTHRPNINVLALNCKVKSKKIGITPASASRDRLNSSFVYD